MSARTLGASVKHRRLTLASPCELEVGRRTAERLRDSPASMFPQMECWDDDERVRRWRLPGSTLVGVVEPRPEAVAAIEISAREWRDARRDRPCGVAAGGVNHVEGCDAAGRSAPRRAGYRGYFAETEHGSVESSFSSSLDQHPLPHRRVLCHIELEPQARRFWAWTQVPDGSLNALLAGRVACISIEPEPKKSAALTLVREAGRQHDLRTIHFGWQREPVENV